MISNSRKIEILILSMTFLFNLQALGHEPTDGSITSSKATELAVHRIERLVVLKKIDPLFANALNSLRTEISTENGAVYKIVATLPRGSDGDFQAITLWMDGQGKTLNFAVKAANPPENSILWPEKDAATLMEEGLHFILESWIPTTNGQAFYPEIKNFYTGLQTISMSPAHDPQGNLFVQFKVSSDDDARTLTINLKPDGIYLSHQVN